MSKQCKRFSADTGLVDLERRASFSDAQRTL